MNSTAPAITNSHWNVQQVGQAFLEHYIYRGYQKIPGTSLLDDSIPTSFVMSAGLVQFEKLSRFSKAGDQYALIQNCFRHFDLQFIGDSSFHLSLFQMPGSFRFGPPEHCLVIQQAWDLATQVYGFNRNHLWVTYFGGAQIDAQYIGPDSATSDAWQKAGVLPEQIVGLGAKENYWKQSKEHVGEAKSRRCGPNTELFYDRGEELSCGPDCRPGCACGRFVEFLNLLFIAWQIGLKNGEITPLELPFTELVIGCERVAALLQGASSVYEIETLDPLVQQVAAAARPGGLNTGECCRCQRVVADHLRALLFLFADGAPSPQGKGERAYIVQKLMRETFTSLQELGISDPGLLPTIMHILVELHPLLSTARLRLLEELGAEQDRFEHTQQERLRKLGDRLQQKPAIQLDEHQIVRIAEGVPAVLIHQFLERRGIQSNLAALQTASQTLRQSYGQPSKQPAQEDET